jgi:hypothetical protein
MKTKTATAQVARGLPTGRRPRVVISTDQVDSERDVVKQDGLEFRERMRVTFGHSYTTLPVGLVTKIDRYAHRTEAEWTWFEGDADVARVKNVYEQGGLDASIGFQVLESSYDAERRGYNILRARVVEFALVPVPANEGAVALAKSLGRGDVDHEIDLDAIPYTPRGSSVALGGDIGLEFIKYDAHEIARLAATPGREHEDIDEDVLRGFSAVQVAGLIRDVIATETAAGLRRVMNDALGRVD